MATIDLGKIKIMWKGTYAGGTAYTPDDAVVHNGTSYICVANTTGNAPPNATYWNVLAQAGTNGTDLTSTLTTQGDILYRDSSGLQRLAAGTNGQALLTGGAGANPSWGTISSDFVKIKTVDITTSTATLDFVHGTAGVVLDNTYKYYKVLVSEVEPVTQGQTLRLRIGSSGSFATSGYLTEAFRSYYSGGTDRGNGTDHLVGLRGGIEDSATGNASVEFTLSNMSDSDKRTMGIAHGAYVDGDDSNPNQVNQGTGGGIYNSASAQDSIRLYMNNGNIGNMSATLYGLKG
tara:strand:- start:31 stop:900 length:870 start_codon:yes stop_codon:yes gene_type:complete